MKQSSPFSRPSKPVRSIAALTASALLSMSASTKAVGETLETTVERIVSEERLAAGAPALSVLVMQDGEVLAQLAEGMANPALGIEADIETAFPVGALNRGNLIGKAAG